MRRLLVAGNWKMHGSQSTTESLIAGIAGGLSDDLAYDVLVCPPSVFLATAQKSVKATPITLGAQNVNANSSGAYTGETSLDMLSELGCEYVLLGHSERRELFVESDQIVAEKFHACVNSEHKITPVLCVGETLEDRQQDSTESVIETQIDAVLNKVGISGFEQAVVAYEPVWAIGTGETASAEQAQQVHAFIRAKLSALDSNVAENIQILYGGSVKADNAQELFSQNDIDGGLIGGASLQAESFLGICHAAQALQT